MPSYFAPTPYDPPEDEPPLLRLEQQYAAAHQARMAARAESASKAKTAQFHKDRTAARERFFAELEQQQAPRDTHNNDR